MIERNLAKVEVAGLSPVSRSNLAKWQSGNAAACKAVNAGSIPTLALCMLEYKRKLHCDTLLISNIVFTETARVAELVDARDLKSLESNLVPVRLRPWALNNEKNVFNCFMFDFI